MNLDPSITDLLKEPFDENLIHWRVGATNAKQLGVKPWEATNGIALAYVNARDVMKRLDDVMGDDWQDDYPYEGCCKIGLRINGEWLWRSDGAGQTDVEGEKGQFSDAFKRAAVKWGVGRYLYYLPNVWCDLEKGKIKKPPSLPEWAKPGYRRFNKGEKDAIYTGIISAMQKGDEMGVAEIFNEYCSDSPEESIKFWTIFNRSERRAINEFLKEE